MRTAPNRNLAEAETRADMPQTCTLPHGKMTKRGKRICPGCKSPLRLSEAADSMAKASTPKPFSKSKTSNWVARAGGLPAYIQHIAHALVKRGKTESNAIQIAIGTVKKWARGGGGVDRNTQMAAVKAVKEWAELKAKNAGRKAAGKLSEADISAIDLLESLERNELELEESLLTDLLDEISGFTLEEARRGARAGIDVPTKQPEQPAVSDAVESVGVRVSHLQRRLTSLGFELRDDGSFGPKTADAVKRFQAHSMLKEDGLVGPKTTEALKGAPAPEHMVDADGDGIADEEVAGAAGEVTDPAGTAVAGSGKAASTAILFKGLGMGEASGNASVKAMQRSLAETGTDCEDDGRFGPETDKAVKKFQRKMGLKSDGIVGPKTMRTIKAMEQRTLTEAATDLVEANAGFEALLAAMVGHGIPEAQAKAILSKNFAESKTPKGASKAQKLAKRGETAKANAVEMKRMPNGMFAPKGQGQVLQQGQEVSVPHTQHEDDPAKNVPGKVTNVDAIGTAHVTLDDGPDKGQPFQVGAKQAAWMHGNGNTAPDIMDEEPPAAVVNADTASQGTMKGEDWIGKDVGGGKVTAHHPHADDPEKDKFTIEHPGGSTKVGYGSLGDYLAGKKKFKAAEPEDDFADQEDDTAEDMFKNVGAQDAPAIPNYDDVELKIGSSAGGSNGAKWAQDESGQKWLVKTYGGDTNRIGTELLANAVYRELGVKVPEAGTKDIDGKPGLTYPALEGAPKEMIFKNGEPSEAVGKDYMADALLANWDFVGMTDDNILWDKDDQPFRVDQGGTFEYRAQGQNKPFGPVPEDVWNMLGKGQAKRGSKVTLPQMKEQAATIAESLTDEKIDGLIDAAPFKDEKMKERLRTNLKARVKWMGEFATGKQEIPEGALPDEVMKAPGNEHKGYLYAAKDGDSFTLDGEQHTVVKSTGKTSQKTVKVKDSKGKEKDLPADTVPDGAGEEDDENGYSADDPEIQPDGSPMDDEDPAGYHTDDEVQAGIDAGELEDLPETTTDDHIGDTSPTGHDLSFSPGRGPTGKMRNFKAMGSVKLKKTIADLEAFGGDPEALAAVKAVAQEKGVAWGEGAPTAPAKKPAVKSYDPATGPSAEEKAANAETMNGASSAADVDAALKASPGGKPESEPSKLMKGGPKKGGGKGPSGAAKLPEAMSPNVGGYSLHELPLGAQFQMNDGSEYKLHKFVNDPWMIAKPTDGGKAKPFHKMMAPAQVGPVAEGYEGAAGAPDAYSSYKQDLKDETNPGPGAAAQAGGDDLMGKLTASVDKAKAAKAKGEKPDFKNDSAAKGKQAAASTAKPSPAGEAALKAYQAAGGDDPAILAALKKAAGILEEARVARHVRHGMRGKLIQVKPYEKKAISVKGTEWRRGRQVFKLHTVGEHDVEMSQVSGSVEDGVLDPTEKFRVSKDDFDEMTPEPSEGTRSAIAAQLEDAEWELSNAEGAGYSQSSGTGWKESRHPGGNDAVADLRERRNELRAALAKLDE